MGELLPCPFCGAKPCEDIQNGYIQKADGSFYQHVWCDTCNASGGEFKTAEEAIERWNTRPRTEGRGEGKPVAYMMKTAGSGSRPVLPSYVYAWREKGVSVDAQPLYASPIREPEISRPDREAVAKIIDPWAMNRAECDPETEAAREEALSKADAILNLAPVGGRGDESSSRADLSPASRSPTPSDLEDEITDALQDSLGPDWTCRDGAKAVVRLLKEARR